MNYIDIDSSQHELYDSWRKLYTVSFPIFEQRTQEQQEKAFSCADYHLVGYSEGDMFVGFIISQCIKDYEGGGMEAKF